MAVSRITQFGNMVTMRIFQSPLTPFNRAIKRAFDVAAAIAGLIVVSPLFVIVALAIKLDSRGPVLFRQKRVAARLQQRAYSRAEIPNDDSDGGWRQFQPCRPTRSTGDSSGTPLAPYQYRRASSVSSIGGTGERPQQGDVHLSIVPNLHRDLPAP
jgi:hypothetical protein